MFWIRRWGQHKRQGEPVRCAEGTRHCERSEAMHSQNNSDNGLLRRFRLRSLSFGGQVAPRDDVRSSKRLEVIVRQQKFGQNGPQVSVIGQGTWYIDHGDRKRAVAALRRGIDLGMTHIDTAEMYGDAELVVADAIAGQRDKIFLVSKVLPSNASQRGTITACERSLKRLKTDRLDCYLLHWRGSYPPAGKGAPVAAIVTPRRKPSLGVHDFLCPPPD